jgi:hypothetical protein
MDIGVDYLHHFLDHFASVLRVAVILCGRKRV